MNRKIKTGIWLVLGFASLIVVAGMLFSGSSNPHFYQVECMDCHLRAPKAGESGTDLFVADIETLCLRCHGDIRLSMSHPIGMKPSFPLPADLPLDWKGELTCSTCHEMHPDEGDTLMTNAFFLRRNSRGRDFCLECHRQDFLSNRRMGHSMAGNAAHYTPGRQSDDSSGTKLDESSAACLTCHDGSLAPDEGIPDLESGVWHHDGYSGGTSHPLGVDYRAAKNRKPRGYREMTQLPDVIKLPDGKVECVSCHNLYSHNQHLLAISNQGSRLCLTCHRK